MSSDNHLDLNRQFWTLRRARKPDHQSESIRLPKGTRENPPFEGNSEEFLQLKYRMTVTQMDTNFLVQDPFQLEVMTRISLWEPKAPPFFLWDPPRRRSQENEGEPSEGGTRERKWTREIPDRTSILWRHSQKPLLISKISHRRSRNFAKVTSLFCVCVKNV